MRGAQYHVACSCSAIAGGSTWTRSWTDWSTATCRCRPWSVTPIPGPPAAVGGAPPVPAVVPDPNAASPRLLALLVLMEVGLERYLSRLVDVLNLPSWLLWFSDELTR